MTNEDNSLSARFMELQAAHNALTEQMRDLQQRHDDFCDVVQDVALSLALKCNAEEIGETIKQAVRLGLAAREEKQNRFFLEENTGGSDTDAYDLGSLHVDTTAFDTKRPHFGDD